MNLIMSDVEETIMIVDQVDGIQDVQPTVNVRNQAFGRELEKC